MAPVRSTPTKGSKPLSRPREWVGGRLSVPIDVVELGAAEPQATIWYELPDDKIVWLQMEDPSQPPPDFAKSLFAAMERPQSGKPRRPACVRVADPAMGAELRQLLSDSIEVRVAPTPELDRLVEILAGELGPGEIDYFADDVPPETLAEYLRASSLLYFAAPWKRVTDDQVVRVDIPKLGVEGACLSLIGNLGESLGFLIFPDFAGYESFVTAAHAQRRRKNVDLGTSFLSLNFEPKRVVPPPLLREIKSQDWRPPDSKSYPVLLRFDRQASPQPVTSHDLEFVTACARGIAIFHDRYGKCFAEEAAEPVSVTIGNDDLDLRFTYPYEAFHLFEEVPGGRPARQAAPAAHRPPRQPVKPPGGGKVVPLPGRRKSVGRNEPCPCGSGRKYKHCHLDADERQYRAMDDDPAPAHVEDARLMHAMRDFARTRFGQVWQRACADPLCKPGNEQVTRAWLAFHYPFAGKPLFEWFLAEPGVRLGASEREWLVAQRRVRLSMWEILTVVPGRGLELRDLLTGAESQVRDVLASQTTRPRDVILARVVDHAEPAVLAGVHPQTLSPMAATFAVERMEKRLRRLGGDRAEQLLDPKLARLALESWEEAILEAERLAAVPPVLHNTDGDPFVLTVDRYEFDTGRRGAITGQIAALEGCHGDDEGGQRGAATTIFSFSNPGNSMHGALENTVIGVVRVASGKLEIETNSMASADRLRQRVEAACGSDLRFVGREETSGAQIFAGLAKEGPKRPRPEAVPGPELAQAIRAHREKMNQAWLDEPIPMLGNRTPRQAARFKRLRQQLDLLLKEMENREARLPEHERTDVARLRRELGLPT